MSTLFTNFNVILPSTFRFPKWAFFFRFLNQIPFEFFFPSQSPCSDHPNKIPVAVHTMKLLIMKFSPFSCHFIPFNPSHLPQSHILKHPRSMFLRQKKKPENFGEICYLPHKIREFMFCANFSLSEVEESWKVMAHARNHISSFGETDESI
jgi:hypothetical protein